MSKRSVKELVDEIECLSIIKSASLTEALEEKLGASRKSQDSFWVDDRVFVMGYDVIITGYTSPKKVLAVKKLHEEWGISINEAVAFFDDLPKTVYEFLPANEALESRRKLMEAGLTVKLNYRWTYFSYYEYSQYNAHQRDMFTSPPVHLIYLTCDPDNQTRNQTEQ